MLNSSIFGNAEIIQVADAVAREKSIPRDAILNVMEEAIRVAARRKYGNEHAVRAEIDRKTGEIRIFREMIVVEDMDEQLPDHVLELYKSIGKISLEEARLKKNDVEVNDIISELLPPIDLGLVEAQSAKQVIIRKVAEIERQKQFAEYQNRVGEIVHGVVERVEKGDVIVKIGNTEALLAKDHLLKADRLRQGDRVRALLVELNSENYGPLLRLSRVHSEFLTKLFAQEVPEIYDNIIQIKAVARDPGNRAKMAVFSADSSVDPIGSCVGMRGARVQAVSNELQGEKIDIILWSSDPANLVINALSPAEVSKVIIDEDKHKIEVVVAEDQLSIAIGKRGQNVRLAAELLGWGIDIITDDIESKRRTDEFNMMTNKFMTALDLEEILAQLLVSEGYQSIAELANAEVADLMNIQGLDEAIAQEIINRAANYIESHNNVTDAEQSAAAQVLGVEQSLLELHDLNDSIIKQLALAGITTLTDFAELARDDFEEIVPNSGLSAAKVDELIMWAREKTLFDKDSN
jgi:N utilization substance protein A